MNRTHNSIQPLRWLQYLVFLGQSWFQPSAGLMLVDWPLAGVVGQQLVGDEGQRLAGVVGQLSVWQGSDQVWPVSESQPGLLHVFRHTFITVIQIIYVYLINNFTMFNNIINNKFDMIVSFVLRTYWKVPCPKNMKKLNSLTMFDLCTVCSSRFIDSCITGCF